MSKLTVKGNRFIIRNLLNSLNSYSSTILNCPFSTKWNLESLYTELNEFDYTSSLCVAHFFDSDLHIRDEDSQGGRRRRRWIQLVKCLLKTNVTAAPLRSLWRVSVSFSTKTQS